MPTAPCGTPRPVPWGQGEPSALGHSCRPPPEPPPPLGPPYGPGPNSRQMGRGGGLHFKASGCEQTPRSPSAPPALPPRPAGPGSAHGYRGRPRPLSQGRWGSAVPGGAGSGWGAPGMDSGVAPSARLRLLPGGCGGEPWGAARHPTHGALPPGTGSASRSGAGCHLQSHGGTGGRGGGAPRGSQLRPGASPRCGSHQRGVGVPPRAAGLGAATRGHADPIRAARGDAMRKRSV